MRFTFVSYLPALFEEDDFHPLIKQSLDFLERNPPQVGEAIASHFLIDYIKASLRRACGWESTDDCGTQVAFGDDFYIYVKSASEISEFEQDGIWVEQFDRWPFD